MFPVKTNDIGVLPPIPAAATLPGSNRRTMFATAADLTAEVDRRVDEFMSDLQPRGHLARFLCRRAASLSVRLELLDRHNAAATAYRVRRAVEEFDQHRLAEVNHLYSWIRAEPATYAGRLRLSPEGIDRLTGAWETLRNDITHEQDPRWGIEHRLLADCLLGTGPHEVQESAFGHYTNAYCNQYSSRVEVDRELAPLPQVERQALARVKLVELIAVEIARLAADRAAVDVEAIELDRVEAADRALVDTSPPGLQLRRYEMATERSIHRCLRTLGQLEFVEEPDTGAAADPADLEAEAPLLDPNPRDNWGSESRDRVYLNRRFRKAAQRAADRRAAETGDEPGPSPWGRF